MHVVKYSPLAGVANKQRLEGCFQKQKQLGKSVYYILPSNKFLQEARKRKAGIAFKTFDDLADLLLKLAGVQYFPVSESERTLFFQELMERDKNRYLQNPQEIRHKAKAFAQTYGQLKRIGLTIEHLPAHFKQLEAIFHEYETEWVKKQRLLDPENRIHEALKLTELDQLNLGGIVIDGYTDFSTLQYLILSYFVKKGIDITIYLPLLSQSHIICDTEQQLRQLGFTVEKGEEQLLEETVVELKSATTVEEEIYGVLEEIVEKQLPYEEVGIILTDENSYKEKLLQVAAKKQLPIKHPVKKQVKHTLFHQFIYQSLLKHNGRFTSRWDSLEIIDTFLRLQFMPSVEYTVHKRMFIEKQELFDKMQDEVDIFIAFRKSLPKKASLIHYLKSVLDVLDASQFTAVWLERLKEETNTKKLQQIRAEWKAYEYFLTVIKRKIQLLEQQKLEHLHVHYHIFVDWLYEHIQGGTIYSERAPRSGINLYSFRDVALFKGTSLYVLGMNEGIFPKVHKLSGYFQESDLNQLPIPFASPTHRLFRKKDDAFFEQLFYVASRISFSYVIGVDPHNPLLPSPYLEQWQDVEQKRLYSASNRFAKQISTTESDKEEKIAYHVGIGKRVEQLPKKLEKIATSLKKLEEGTETVSSKWQDQLKRDKLSVTMLESYAVCPFKFSFEQILEVKEPLEKKTTIDFRFIGSMIHTIIEKFYKQLDLIGKPFSTYTDELKEKAETILIDIFEEEWELVEAQHLDFSKLRLSIEKEEWKKKLYKWWLAEKKHFWENKHLQSMHLFRLEENVDLDIKIDEETTITLSGKIDRIDIDEDGFVIYDYKSGYASLNFEKEVRPGLKLQLPLYLVAMEKRLANGHYSIDLTEKFKQIIPNNLTAHGASYISFRDPVKRAGNSVWREEHFGKGSRFDVYHTATKEESLEGETLLAKYELKKRLKQLWHGSSSDFSVKPIKCMNSCVYKPVCRVTQDLIEEGEGEWK